AQAGDDDGKKLKEIGSTTSDGNLGPLRDAVKEAANNPQASTFIKYLAQQWEWTKLVHAKYVDKVANGQGYFELKLDQKGDQPEQTQKIKTDGSMEWDGESVKYDQNDKVITGSDKLSQFRGRLYDIGNPPDLPDIPRPKLSPAMSARFDKINDGLNNQDPSE